MTRTRSYDSSVSSQFDITAVDAALTAVLLVTAASAVAVSLGEPELIALVATVGVAVTLCGLVALSERGAFELLADGTPLYGQA